MCHWKPRFIASTYGVRKFLSGKKIEYGADKLRIGRSVRARESAAPRHSTQVPPAAPTRRPEAADTVEQEVVRLAHADDVGVDRIEEDAESAADEQVALAGGVIRKAEARRDSVKVGGHQRWQDSVVAGKAEPAGGRGERPSTGYREQTSPTVRAARTTGRAVRSAGRS
jgi:hypothetical protein